MTNNDSSQNDNYFQFCTEDERRLSFIDILHPQSQYDGIDVYRTSASDTGCQERFFGYRWRTKD